MVTEKKWKAGKKLPSETVVAVATAKLANPDLSTRDIAKETGASKSSTARILNEEMGQAGAIAKKAGLYETNIEIIAAASRKVADAMVTMNPESIRDAKEMQSIVDTAFKQNQLIDGKPTGNIGLSSLKSLSNEQLQALIDAETD